MSNSEQREFLKSVEAALTDKSFRRVTFSSRGKGKDKFQAKFELIAGETKPLIRYSTNADASGAAGASGASGALSDLDEVKLLEQMSSPEISSFRAATLSTSTFDLHYAENRKGVARLYQSKPSFKGPVPTHNRAKNYLLQQDRPYLRGLGIASSNSKIIKKQHGKFRQIANFVEIIDRDIGEFVAQSNEPISVLDLGCGKGYLTFATYDYIQSRAKTEPVVTGIDIKSDVIGLCNDLAKSINFNGLTFKNAKIEPTKPQDVDILIALHACDTATDDALALGVRSNMKFLFCAPCCQAEIAAQASDTDTSFRLITTYPLMKRRQSDIITDTCRALLLEALGYEVKFLEFTAIEHTAKNIMLAGKKNPDVDRRKAFASYNELKNAFGFKHHALEKNLSDLLKKL